MKKYFLLLIVIATGNLLFAQNVGIGTTTPNPSAALEIRSSNRGLLIPRMNSFDRVLIANPANGLMVYDTTQNRIYQYQNGAWQYFINDNYWRIAPTRNWTYNTTDSIGIGTSAPTNRLDVNGNIRSRDDVLADGRVIATGTVTGSGLITSGGLTVGSNGLIGGNLTVNSNLSTNSDLIINNVGATLQLKNGSNVNKGFFQLSGDDVRFGTNSGNNLGNVIVRMNGNNRFTFTDEGRFTLSADNTPTINFNSGGFPKASLQVQGEDLTINAPGNKVRISNVVYVDDATNRVGIGTISPTERLHVSGDVLITGKTTINDTVKVNEHLSAYSGFFGRLEVANSYAAPGSYFAIGSNAEAGGFLTGAIGDDVTTLGSASYSYIIGSDAELGGSGCILFTDGPGGRGVVSRTTIDNKMYTYFRNGYQFNTGSGTGAVMLGGDNSWSSVCDSTKKENYKPVNGNEFLQKIAGMKLGSWNYKEQEKTKRHYGPMAQEMFANFGNDGIGIIGNDTTIATADIDGVMMIAIQALEKRTADQQRDISIFKKEVADLKAIIAEQKKLLDAIIGPKNKQ